MSKMKKSLEVEGLKQLHKKFNIKKGNSSVNILFEKHERAQALLNHILHVERNSMIRNEARKNFIVNLVTSMEVFLKQVIVECKGVWNKEGFATLLNETITLNEAYDLFKASKIEREHLIGHYYGFQNIGAIDKVFSALTNTKFLNTIGAYKILPNQKDDFRLNDIEKDWRKIIESLFQLRHKIIHEDDNTPIPAAVPKYYSSLMMSFLFTVWVFPTQTKIRGERF